MMRNTYENRYRQGMAIAFLTLFLASILGSVFAKNPTITSTLEQRTALLSPHSNGVSIFNYVEDFNNWANGQAITGEASGEHVHWVISSTGTPTFQGSSTVISSGNSGVINDANTVYSISAAAEYDTPSPQTPNATNQYWQAIDIKITSAGLSQVLMSQVLGYPGASGQVCVTFNANGSLTVNVLPSGKWIGTGLTWSLNTKYTLVMQCLSASTSRFSLDGGNTWSQAFMNYGNWTGPVKELCLYTGAALTSTAYVDNIGVCWAQLNPTVPSAPQLLSATSGSGQVVLNWTAPSSDGGSAITGYNVYCGTSSGSETLLATIGNVLNYTATGLTNGQVYYFKVAAVNIMGTGANSTEVIAIPVLSGTQTIENFEEYTTGSSLPGQGLWSSQFGYLAPTVAVGPYAGDTSHVGKFQDNPGVQNAAAWWQLPAGQSTTGWNCFSCKVAVDSSNDAFVFFNGFTAIGGTCTFYVQFQGAGMNAGHLTAYLQNSATTIVMGTYSVGTWYDFNIFWSNSAHVMWIEYSVNSGSVNVYSNRSSGYFYGNYSMAYTNPYQHRNYGHTGYIDDIVTSWNSTSNIPITPTEPQGFIIIIIIIMVGAAVGVSVGTTYQVRVKRLRTGTASSKASAKKSMTSYAEVPGPSNDPSVAAFNKRARLMQITPAETENVPVKAKLSSSSEPDVDMPSRLAGAREMESQVNVMPVMTKCVVHKGPITGFSYTCKHCGVPYCIDCYNHLVTTGEACWNCGNAIDSKVDDVENQQDLVAEEFKGVSTMFDPEILEKIRNLDIPSEIHQELLRILKEIPRDQRLQYLEDTFKEENAP